MQIRIRRITAATKVATMSTIASSNNAAEYSSCVNALSEQARNPTAQSQKHNVGPPFRWKGAGAVLPSPRQQYR
jgi:hypothetical protein